MKPVHKAGLLIGLLPKPKPADMKGRESKDSERAESSLLFAIGSGLDVSETPKANVAARYGEGKVPPVSHR
jgi:hypothetical protein